ncbi:unknown (plasmid) [Haloarcula marismortui ATCC 43049]|uniref:Uncharacterized protein n=1 Tax=Haloarcula marismortui (strain ATCC 43049 / DSM 3752 / JCM 8966 / VKM B-1809) TaxID=272569 RepID=Q5V809_HALMA|nr:unknown [Haloarcula marismortui ATCC 43049]
MPTTASRTAPQPEMLICIHRLLCRRARVQRQPHDQRRQEHDQRLFARQPEDHRATAGQRASADERRRRAPEESAGIHATEKAAHQSRRQPGRAAFEPLNRVGRLCQHRRVLADHVEHHDHDGPAGRRRRRHLWHRPTSGLSAVPVRYVRLICSF